MARTQETFSKKEVRNRKEKKRKEKDQKRLKKKSEGKKSGLDDMIAYVDEYGMITSTPPDPTKRSVISADSIELKITKNRPEATTSSLRKGVVTFFNDSKGFGFIQDLTSNQRVFVHANNLTEPIKENNIVVFELERGPKGYSAVKVRLFKENQEAVSPITPDQS